MVDNKENINNNNLDDKFVFIERKEFFFDKKFEGKPRGFFADAMVRFTKNKVNLVATSIVFLFVLLSIIVPMVSTKDFTSTVVKGLQNLPPRIPFLENIGIADGTLEVSEFPVDLNSVDPETGLYLPMETENAKYDPAYIKTGSLTNGKKIGTTRDSKYVGGTNLISIEKFMSYTVSSVGLQDSEKKPLRYDIDDSMVATVSLKSISDNSQLTLFFVETEIVIVIENVNGVEVEVEKENIISRTPLMVINSNTITEVDGEDERYSQSADVGVSGKGYLEVHFENLTANPAPMSVDLYDIGIGKNGSNDVYFEGYTLCQWRGVSESDQGGSFSRQNAVFNYCSFSYYAYNKMFEDVRYFDMPGSDFEKYMNEYPVLAEQFSEQWAQVVEVRDNFPANKRSVSFDFSDIEFEGTGIPVRKVRTVTVSTNIFLPGVVTVQMVVDLDGPMYYGFESLPYFWFGTDKDGRDMFGMIWLGLRTSLLLGLIVTVINVVIGVIYGAIEGYYGGRVDFVMERIAEYISSFPGLTILTIIYLSYGPGLWLLLIYLTYSGWIGTAGTTRIQFYRYRGREYVLASRTLGASDARLIFKHILPNGIGIIITRSILSIPAMIFTEASLSFLGFGIGHGVTLDFGIFQLPGLSLGVILNDGFNTMLIPGMFYQMLIPATIIIILMISFNMFGNALRDAVNPTLRGSN